MEFRLNYRGALKGNGNAAQKHQLRQHFHKQLAELWKQPPLAQHTHLASAMPLNGKITLSIDLSPFRFVPLVSSRIHSIAEINCVLLRPGPPGDILRGGGDIDNRLKTLLDALKVPESNAVPKEVKPEENEDPFYCLLEDDKLVTRIDVETDRLLDPKNDREVILILHVLTKYTEKVYANLGL